MHPPAAFERVLYADVNTMHTHSATFSACSAVCPSHNNSVFKDTQRSINMSTVDRDLISFMVEGCCASVQDVILNAESWRRASVDVRCQM